MRELIDRLKTHLEHPHLPLNPTLWAAFAADLRALLDHLAGEASAPAAPAVTEEASTHDG